MWWVLRCQRFCCSYVQTYALKQISIQLPLSPAFLYFFIACNNTAQWFLSHAILFFHSIVIAFSTGAFDFFFVLWKFNRSIACFSCVLVLSAWAALIPTYQHTYILYIHYYICIYKNCVVFLYSFLTILLAFCCQLFCYKLKHFKSACVDRIDRFAIYAIKLIFDFP